MKKITAEELLKVQELRRSLTEIITTVGELHLNKVMLQSDLHKVDAEMLLQERNFEEFQKNERVLYEMLQTKYGTGTIDLETGEITE